MIKTNGFRVLAMVMTTLWMVTIIPVTVVQAADFRGQDLIYQAIMEP